MRKSHLIFTSLLTLSLLNSCQAETPSAETTPDTPAAMSQAAVTQPEKTEKNIKTELIEYKEGDTVLEGYLAYDENIEGKRPGVLVIHEWTGVNDYVKRRAEQLAELGYVAFAADIYGKGVRPTPPQETAAEAGKYYENRDLAKARANAGFEVLKNHERVDSAKTAAMGYCFGGTMTLELARSGAPLKGFVSFHGGLNPTEDEGKNIQGKVLVLHGADDPFVPQEDIAKFQTEMNSANIDWQMVYYSGAVHAFSNPDAGDDPSGGAAYNEKADMRSWEAMKDFFNEIF